MTANPIMLAALKSCLPVLEAMQRSMRHEASQAGMGGDGPLLQEVRAAIEAGEATTAPGHPSFAIIIENLSVVEVVAKDPKFLGVSYITIDHDVEAIEEADGLHVIPYRGGRAAYICESKVGWAKFPVGKRDSYERFTSEDQDQDQF